MTTERDNELERLKERYDFETQQLKNRIVNLTSALEIRESIIDDRYKELREMDARIAGRKGMVPAAELEIERGYRKNECEAYQRRLVKLVAEAVKAERERIRAVLSDWIFNGKKLGNGPILDELLNPPAESEIE